MRAEAPSKADQPWRSRIAECGEAELLAMLRKRHVKLQVEAEMRVGPQNPEIKPHVIETLRDAMIASHEAERDEVVIPEQTARWLLQMIEGPGRGRRGRRPREDIGPEIIVKLAKLWKGELVSAGRGATDAGAEAAERAERVARQHGIELASSTIEDRIGRR